MRPRPEGRGEQIDHPAFEQPMIQLQCGHDPKAVENLALADALRATHLASMRPRPEGRGERL